MRLRSAVSALILLLCAIPAMAGLPPLHNEFEIAKAIQNGLIPAIDVECSTLDVFSYNATTNRWGCSSVAATTATAGAGLLNTAGTWSTDSTEANFISSTAVTCGSTNTKGRASVNGKLLSYCNADTTNTLSYAMLANSAGLGPAVQTVTVADSGNGSAATATLTPTAGVVKLTCSDTDGCTITMGEGSATEGDIVRIVNISANEATFADTAGLSELTGAVVLGQRDTLSLIYVDSTWNELSASNN